MGSDPRSRDPRSRNPLGCNVIDLGGVMSRRHDENANRVGSCLFVFVFLAMVRVNENEKQHGGENRLDGRRE